jgi:chlorite dismutase
VASPLMVSFCAGAIGPWWIDRIDPVFGESLPLAAKLSIRTDTPIAPVASVWNLSGVTSNTRYATRSEVDALVRKQEGLGRTQAICAALIPIRKSEAWWALAQDERRAIMEERSRHIGIGMDYLPAISRRLHHSREIGEPFDFLTWFEYAPEHAGDFEEMVDRLRATEEWKYVDREVDIRLLRTFD